MNPFLVSALADERIRDMHRTAARRRLVALVRCCRPAAWRRTATRARVAAAATIERLRGRSLGPAENYCACS